MGERIAIPEARDPSANEEMKYYAALYPSLAQALGASGGADELITLANLKSGYSAVRCGNFTLFRIRMRQGQRYLAVPQMFADLIPADYPTKILKSAPEYIRLLIDEEHPADFYSDLLATIVQKTLDRYPKEWDCCSRYMECSDAGKCVHPNKTFALGCGYRKILASGEIFYGENRNVE